MIMTLHGQTTRHSNLVTDIRTAAEAGYGALEIATPKLLRYIDAGLPVEELLPVFHRHSVVPACIDILGDVERIKPKERDRLFLEAEGICRVAHLLNCPTVQLNAFCGLAGRPFREIVRITAKNIVEISAIGRGYGVRFQIEGAAWTPIHSLSQCLQLLEEIDRDNIGLVLDFWHLWASYDTSPEEIARLDKSIIYGVHICDGIRPKRGDPWPDEKTLRGYLPGDGHLPVAEWVAAVKGTGFDGFWSGEIMCSRMWERDHLDIARAMHQRMERFLEDN
jgi:sugar phosphate isomerase/epimerase